MFSLSISQILTANYFQKRIFFKSENLKFFEILKPRKCSVKWKKFTCWNRWRYLRVTFIYLNKIKNCVGVSSAEILEMEWYAEEMKI